MKQQLKSYWKIQSYLRTPNCGFIQNTDCLQHKIPELVSNLFHLYFDQWTTVAGDGSIQDCKEIRPTASERWQELRVKTTLLHDISTWRDVLFATGTGECLTTDRKRADGPGKEREWHTCPFIVQILEDTPMLQVVFFTFSLPSPLLHLVLVITQY